MAPIHSKPKVKKDLPYIKNTQVTDLSDDSDNESNLFDNLPKESMLQDKKLPKEIYNEGVNLNSVGPILSLMKEQRTNLSISDIVGLIAALHRVLYGKTDSIFEHCDIKEDAEETYVESYITATDNALDLGSFPKCEADDGFDKDQQKAVKVLNAIREAFNDEQVTLEDGTVIEIKGVHFQDSAHKSLLAALLFIL